MPEQRAARLAGTLRARIPREYQDASFQHSNISGLPRHAVAAVRHYVDTLDERLAEGDGLWLSGSIGTGKTWLAMLVARVAIERGRGVAVYSVPRLLSEIRRTYDGEGRTTLELLDQLTSVPLLVLDDAGTERTNPWVLEQLYTIINERWQERRSIVMTTNLDMIQMEERLGERAASRLVGMCKTVLLDGVDHRTGRHHLDPGLTGFEGGPTDRVGAGPGDGRGPGGPLGAPPPLDPETAAWAAGAAPAFDAPTAVGAGRASGDGDRHVGPDGHGRRPSGTRGPGGDGRPPGEERPASRDGFGAPPPPRTFGVDPSEARRPERRRFEG